MKKKANKIIDIKYIFTNFKKNISIQEVFFYIYWTILLVGKGLGYTSSYKPFRIMTWIAIIFAVVKLCLTKWEKSEFICCTLINLCGLLVWYFSGDTAVLLTTISISALKNVEFSKLLKYSFWVKAILFISRTSMAILGIIDSQIMVRYDSGDIHTVRYALGYGHPNATHYVLFSIIVLLVLAYKDNLKLKYLIIALGYNIFIFKYTNSRTGFILTSFFIVTCILCKEFLKSKKINNIICLFITNIYIILGLISIFIPLIMLCGFEPSGSLGTLLMRFYTGINVIQNNHVNIFGTKGIVTDFGYINILYNNGIIIFLLYILGNTKLLRYFKTYNMKYEMIVFFTYAIYTLMESYSISILMNISLIYFSKILYSKSTLNNTY